MTNLNGKMTESLNLWGPCDVMDKGKQGSSVVFCNSCGPGGNLVGDVPNTCYFSFIASLVA